MLLRAAPPKTTPEQAAAILPANFEEVATLVLRVLNNLARLDLKLFQAQLVGHPVSPFLAVCLLVLTSRASFLLSLSVHFYLSTELLPSKAVCAS